MCVFLPDISHVLSLPNVLPIQQQLPYKSVREREPGEREGGIVGQPLPWVLGDFPSEKVE